MKTLEEVFSSKEQKELLEKYDVLIHSPNT